MARMIQVRNVDVQMCDRCVRHALRQQGARHEYETSLTRFRQARIVPQGVKLRISEPTQPIQALGLGLPQKLHGLETQRETNSLKYVAHCLHNLNMSALFFRFLQKHKGERSAHI